MHLSTESAPAEQNARRRIAITALTVLVLVLVLMLMLLLILYETQQLSRRRRVGFGHWRER
jgi:hypothetical protein